MYQIPKETLAKVLCGFRTLKPNRANLPVLQCLKIEVKAGKVRLCGTNLDDHLRCRIEGAEATLDSEPLLVPFSTLQEAVKAADKNTPVRIEPGRVRIRASATEMARSYEPVDVTEFPSWGEAPGGNEIVLKPGVMEALGEAAIAASTDPTRHVLCGIHLTANTVVATNGRRIVVRHLDRTHRLQGLGDEGVILPARSSLNLFKADRPATLRLYDDGARGKDNASGDRRLELTQGAWCWNTKPVDGNYPNWRQVMPKDGTTATRITLADEEAARLCDILPKLPQAKDEHAPVDLRVEGNRVYVKAGQGASANTVTLAKAKIDGPAVTCRFNRRFLCDALAQGFRQIAVRDELSPLLMEDREKNRIHLWMPLGPPHPAPRPAAKPESPAPAARRETVPVNGVTRPTATNATNDRKPTPMPENNQQPTPNGPGSNGRHAEPDPAARVRDALTRLRDLVRDVHGAVQEVSTALREADREKKALEREHASLRRNLRGLKSIPL